MTAAAAAECRFRFKKTPRIYASMEEAV